MTAHELAAALLAGPDLPVYVLDEDNDEEDVPVRAVNRWTEPRRVTVSGWTE